jgi:hypothetical protein
VFVASMYMIFIYIYIYIYIYIIYKNVQERLDPILYTEAWDGDEYKGSKWNELTIGLLITILVWAGIPNLNQKFLYISVLFRNPNSVVQKWPKVTKM